MGITIDITIAAPLKTVWTAWTTPEDITQWNFASDDWFCPRASIDLREGGTFSSRMEAKDGSMGFDFEGRFTSVIDLSEIEYELEDKRKVLVTFSEVEGGTKVVEIFDSEDENSGELQRKGWQSILHNFKKHVESD